MLLTRNCYVDTANVGAAIEISLQNMLQGRRNWSSRYRCHFAVHKLDAARHVLRVGSAAARATSTTAASRSARGHSPRARGRDHLEIDCILHVTRHVCPSHSSSSSLGSCTCSRARPCARLQRGLHSGVCPIATTSRQLRTATRRCHHGADAQRAELLAPVVGELAMNFVCQHRAVVARAQCARTSCRTLGHYACASVKPQSS